MLCLRNKLCFVIALSIGFVLLFALSIGAESENASIGGKMEIPTAKFQYINGSPVLKINGKTHTAMNYWIDVPEVADLIENCRDNGIHIYWLTVAPTPWKSGGEFDFSILDKRLATLLSKDPNAYVFCIVPLDNQINTGLAAWTDAHPSELVKTSEDTTIPDYGGNNSVAPSLASKVWQNMTADLLKKLIGHIKTGEYADRVIGYIPASGVSYEWQQWGSVAWPPVFVDYSECARVAFVEWLQKKFKRVDKLNSAWKTNYVSFDEVQIPSKESRCRRDLFTFLDPETSRSEIDFRRYYSDVVANDILRLARVIKEETEGKSIFGVFYGYVAHVLGPYRYQLIGHSSLRKALDSPDIDFLVSPSDYGDRQVGGASGFMSVTDSVRLNKKVWVDQADLRTHHAHIEPRAADLNDSKACMIRHFGSALAAGCVEQLYDFSAGWTAGDKQLMEVAGKLRQIESRIYDVPRKMFDVDRSIAVIIDEQSTDYTDMASSIHNEAIVFQWPALARTGVGFDTYLLDDIAKFPKYKCYLFLNTFRITKDQAKRIGALKRNGNVLIFVYAPGITDGDKLDLNRVSEITGIKMDIKKEEAAHRINIPKDALGLKNNVVYGTGNPYGPLFIPKEGEVIGTEEGSLSPGLVMKKYPNWTSVYSVSPNIPASVLSKIAEQAGISIVNPYEGDITFVGDRVVVVHTVDGGSRKLNIGRDYKEAEELISGKTYPLKNGFAEVKLEARSTSIFLAK